MAEEALVLCAGGAVDETLGAYSGVTLRKCIDVDGVTGGVFNNGSAQCAAASPSGGLLAVGSSSGTLLRVFNTATWTTVTISGGQPTGSVNDLAFSPDGTRLAVAHATSPFLTVYDTTTWAKLSLTGGNPPAMGNGCAFSPNGAMLAVAHNNFPFFSVYDNTLTKITTGVDAQNTGFGCAFSPDNTLLAIASNSAGLTVFNTSTWATVTSSSMGGGRSCAFSPNGTRLAFTGTSSPYIRVLNTSTWTAITLTGGGLSDEAYSCSFSEDSSRLAVAGASENRPVVYNTSTWAKVTVSQLHGGWMRFVRYMRNFTTKNVSGAVVDDEGFLANRTVRLHDRATGAVYATATSPGGQYHFTILATQEMQRIALDNNNDAPLNNDIIDRVVPS